MNRLDPSNSPLAAHGRARGHDLLTRREVPQDDWVLALAFSGGGTRAAALAYGVLEELARTTFRRPRGLRAAPREHRMLDQVQAISAVSGGSFTAAYYAIYGDRIFEDFEKKFLHRDVPAAILRRMASPQNWLPLVSKHIGRSDLAGEFYDREIFAGATFGDLLNQPSRPDLLINATDMVTGQPFAFTQRNFDRLDSDLTRMPIGRAVAASTAAPLLLSPITLRNHAAMDTAARRVRGPLSSELRAGFDTDADAGADDRPFLHLVDGGVSDNLGLRGMLDLAGPGGGFDALLRQCQFGRARNIAVIVVNAATEHTATWSHRSHPGVTDVLQAISEHATHESSARALTDFRRGLEEWRQGELAADGTPVRKFQLIEVDFSQLTDPDERFFFRGLPTSLSLPARTVERLREVGGRLLRQSEGFRQLRNDFAAEPAPAERELFHLDHAEEPLAALAG